MASTGRWCSGGAEPLGGGCVDGEGFAVDEDHHGHGAAGGGEVDRFGGVGNGGGVHQEAALQKASKRNR
jgi:hypothetical protein